MKRENYIRNFLAAAFIAGLIFQQAITVNAASGELDLTFGVGGKVMTQSGDRYANAVALQPDGKIIVAGGSGGKAPSTSNNRLSNNNSGRSTS